jgi:hypothetical protein
MSPGQASPEAEAMVEAITHIATAYVHLSSIQTDHCQKMAIVLQVMLDELPKTFKADLLTPPAQHL